MKVKLYVVFVAPLIAIGSSKASAFEYFENFELYQKGSNFSSAQNNEITRQNSVIFSSGVSTELVSLNDSSNWAGEIIPDSPKNPNIVASNPSEHRIGNCVNCVIQFSYSGSSDLTKDAWSEQRFLINPAFQADHDEGLTNLWLQYDLYVPENFHFRDPNPSYGNWYGGGDKVLALWADDYSDSSKPMLVISKLLKRIGNPGEVWDKDTAFTEYWFASNAPETNERRYFDDRGIEGDYQTLIEPSVDKGHWQRRTLHIRMPTSETSNDGVVEYWIQRRADTDSPITTKVLNAKNGNFHGGDKNYINQGYLLGWSNAGYNYDVKYLVDNFILSNDIESIDASAIDVNADKYSLPNPPDMLSVD